MQSSHDLTGPASCSRRPIWRWATTTRGTSVGLTARDIAVQCMSLDCNTASTRSRTGTQGRLDCAQLVSSVTFGSVIHDEQRLTDGRSGPT